MVASIFCSKRILALDFNLGAADANCHNLHQSRRPSCICTIRFILFLWNGPFYYELIAARQSHKKASFLVWARSLRRRGRIGRGSGIVSEQ